MSTLKSDILGATLAIISSVALFFYVVISFLHLAAVHDAPHDFSDYVHFTAQTSFDITTGHPLGRIFQNRVLGPYIIKALSFGSSDHYGTAYVCFQIVTVAIAAFLCWRLGRKYGGNNQYSLLALMLFIICFASLQSPPLLYSWDFIDIIVFIVFLDFVLSSLSLPWFLGIFAIAIFNRDSATFIALWLILDPLVRFLYQRLYVLAKAPLDWHRILAGTICIGAGLVIAELLKRNLLIEEVAPKLGSAAGLSSNLGLVQAAGLSYNLGLVQNVYFLSHALFDLKFWVVVPFLSVAIALGAKLVRLDPQRYLAVYLVELSMIVSLLLFSLFEESRVFLILIPFVVVSGVLVSASDRRRTLARDALKIQS